eukprot:TRINITY_DN12578_c0_g2_i1.p1 TRINITY_DN12578_c0_g2~~TRINITY_DN12578_c0_g2_i1.p1  ORF type:complete len:422 (+),score=93.58 TRINITY_DN12578_c0_g2_i1:100-1365(+)
MIEYSVDSTRICFIFQMRGSVMGPSFLIALPSAAISAVVVLADRYRKDTFPDAVDIEVDTAAWSMFISVVGFLLIFRSSTAYDRFWSGCEASYAMRAYWFDAFSSLMSFCSQSKADPKLITNFKHVVVRLFSMVHALALAELENNEDEEESLLNKLEVIDLAGLNPNSLRYVKACHARAELAFLWIQQVIVENIQNGVLSVPAPIMTRAFQEAATGMMGFHEAQAIVSVPYPFPFAQTTQLLLWMHWCMCPLVTAVWVEHAQFAFLTCFVQVLILFCLNSISIQLENPFGQDDNDFDAPKLQALFNGELLALLSPDAGNLPSLSKAAELNGRKLMTHGIGGLQNFNEVLANLEEVEACEEQEVQALDFDVQGGGLDEIIANAKLDPRQRAMLYRHMVALVDGVTAAEYSREHTRLGEHEKE